MADFGKLPLEIVLNIADQVDVADLHPWTLVSKQFYARTNPILWHQPPLRSPDALRQFCTVLNESPDPAKLVRVIDIGNFGPTHSTLNNVLRLLPHLEVLHIQHGQSLGNNDVFPQHLVSLYIENKFISDFFIMNLANQCQSLRRLHLLHCPGLTSQAFSWLTRLPLLEELSIDVGGQYPAVGMWQHDDDNNDNNNNNNEETWREKIVLDLAQLNNLTHLTIHQPPTFLPRDIATTRMDRAGNPTWPHLVHLYLECCIDLDDTFLIGFLESHRLLESIVLVQGKFTDASLDAMVRCLSTGLTNVEILNNHQITYEGIRRLVLGCPTLEFVHLMGCHILRHHFPEAGENCLDPSSLVKMYINCLDWDAIDKIRQGLDCEMNDDRLLDFYNDNDMEEDDEGNGYYDVMSLYDDDDDDDDDEDDDDDYDDYYD